MTKQEFVTTISCQSRHQHTSNLSSNMDIKEDEGKELKRSTSSQKGSSGQVFQIVETKSNELRDISNVIWKRPELMFQEELAHKILTDFLFKENFKVERSYILPTAFRATFSKGEGPTVCVICEYDALPEIGHACGHNLIAEAGLGAALGVKGALENGLAKGTLICLGTPAEEGGCGKEDLIKGGAFKGVDCAMMVHPADVTFLYEQVNACSIVDVVFKGKSAHAAASPWEGCNALDAAVNAYNSLSMLRQQTKPASRIHCIFKEAGVKPNIIPSRSSIECYLRAEDMAELKILESKASACFESAALATGCKVEYKFHDKRYMNLNHNHKMGDTFLKFAQQLGMAFKVKPMDKEAPKGGSTDMGNVSHEVPSIQPLFKIGSGADSIHTPGFTTAAGTPHAHQCALRAAKAMAMTAIEIFNNSELLDDIKKEFSKKIRTQFQ